MKKVSGGWRVTAIILAIILALIAMFISYGSTIVQTENRCANYCVDHGHDSFYYDTGLKQCLCFTGQNVSAIVPSSEL